MRLPVRLGAYLAKFHTALLDFPVSELEYTIPDFHNTIKRFSDFEESIQKASPERLAQAKESIDTMEVKLKQISDILKSKESSSVELNNRIIQIAADAKEVEKAIREVKSLEEKIKRINERNILKQNYYIVPSISYSLKDAEKKFYLKPLFQSCQ